MTWPVAIGIGIIDLHYVVTWSHWTTFKSQPKMFKQFTDACSDLPPLGEKLSGLHTYGEISLC